MSLSREPVLDDRQLERYLLGLLPDEDAERVDELSVADEDVALRLRVAEDDLIDAYVGGRLAGATLERFESFYLASPRRRQKVEFAESLRRASDRTVVSSPARVREFVRPAADARPTRPSFFWQYAAVAALVTVVCGAIGVENWRLRSGVNQAQQDNAALVQHAHDLEARASAQHPAPAGIDSQRERGGAPQVGQTAPSTSPGRSGSGSPALATALVLFSQTRAVGAIPQFPVPPAGEDVAVDLRLESDDRARYQVVLKDPVADQAIWRSAFVAATVSNDQPTVSIVVPGQLLKPQHYSFELIGRDADGRDQTLGSYTVQVVPR